jgi:hypothetical protein
MNNTAIRAHHFRCILVPLTEVPNLVYSVYQVYQNQVPNLDMFVPLVYTPIGCIPRVPKSRVPSSLSVLFFKRFTGNKRTPAAFYKYSIDCVCMIFDWQSTRAGGALW